MFYKYLSFFHPICDSLQKPLFFIRANTDIYLIFTDYIYEIQSPLQKQLRDMLISRSVKVTDTHLLKQIRYIIMLEYVYLSHKSELFFRSVEFLTFCFSEESRLGFKTIKLIPLSHQPFSVSCFYLPDGRESNDPSVKGIVRNNQPTKIIQWSDTRVTEILKVPS